MGVNLSTANYLKSSGAVAVGASATETVVVTCANLSAEDTLNIKVRLETSVAVETTGITWKLQHSWDGTNFEDVNPGAALATVALGGTLILADATIITADDDVVLASHGFNTGDEIYYHCDGAGIVTGLANNTIYYAIYETSGKFQLASTRALAIAGTAIVLTQPTGGDGHFFTPTFSTLSLNVENSTDEPVLPLWEKLRIVATTGALDQFTVTDAYISRRV